MNSFPGPNSVRIRAVVMAAMLCVWFSPSAHSWQNEPSRSVGVQIIVVGSEAEARQILDRLHKGEDFAKLAREKSTDPTAADGGDMGKVDPETLNIALRDA